MGNCYRQYSSTTTVCINSPPFVTYVGTKNGTMKLTVDFPENRQNWNSSLNKFKYHSTSSLQA